MSLKLIKKEQSLKLVKDCCVLYIMVFMYWTIAMELSTSKHVNYFVTDRSEIFSVCLKVYFLDLLCLIACNKVSVNFLCNFSVC